MDLIRHPLRLLGGEEQLAVAGEHERRDVDRRQRRADIDPAVHSLERDRSSGTRGVTKVVREPTDRVVIVRKRGRAPVSYFLRRELPRTPDPLDRLDVALMLLVGGYRERVVNRRSPACAGPEQNKRDGPLWIRRGEQRGHRTTLREAHHDGAL